MAVAATPEPGSIITYLDPTASDDHPFSRAVACAGPIPDPQTDRTWIPALRERQGARPVTTLVDQQMIVDVRPPDQALRRPGDPVGVLRAALDAALGELTDLDGPRHGPEARKTFTALLDTIAPARQALLDQLDADPHGPMKLVLGYLDNAVAAVDAGDMAAGRAALRTAQVAMTTVVPDQQD
jgi:hypothetical protein